MSNPSSRQKRVPIEVYKGIPVFASNIINIRITPKCFKELLDLSESTGLSFNKLLSLSAKPCEKCEHTGIQHFKEDGNEVKIRRGINSIDDTKQVQGGNIFKRPRKKSA